MSDAAHLLIPFASSDDPGCAQARAGLQLPALARLLARLELAQSDEGGPDTLSMPHERALARACGMEAPDGCIPLAAWQLAQSGRDPQGDAWAWVTPCHWRVGQDHVAMADPSQLGLSAGESHSFFAAMQPWFLQDGIHLEWDAPTRWLARGEVFRSFATASLDRVSGRVIDRWMPRGDAAKALRRLQQEMQMLLYTHPLNEERARAGLAPLNSFWVSGTGALAPAASKAAAPAPMQVVASLREPALAQDWPAWAQAWRRIDEEHCAGLLEALERGEQVALTLCGERNCRTFRGAGGGFFGKLRASLRAGRAAQQLDAL